MTIPYTFAGATTAIPLAQLDANFASPITLGNVAMTLSSTYNSIGNLTLTNVTVSSGNVAVTNANVTTLTATNDASISGLTVGKGTASLRNTVVGQGALNANTTGVSGTYIGYQTGYTNTTGTSNTFIGEQSGYFNTTGTYNTGLGQGSYASNSTSATGSYNTSVGGLALYNNTTASNNTAVGYQSLYANTTGASNVVLGTYAGGGVTTGNNNVCVGYGAGQYSTVLTTGGQNLYVGTNAGASSASVSYEMVITTLNSVGKGSSTGYINANGGGIYQGNNSTLWSITSDARLKKNIVDNTVGLDAINKIQVRNFEYRTADEITELPKEQAIDIKGVQLGAIAQELQAVLPECVKTESTGVMSVDASNITWYLVNAIQELKAEIDLLKGK